MIVNSIPFMSNYGPQALESKLRDFSSGSPLFVSASKYQRRAVQQQFEPVFEPQTLTVSVASQTPSAVLAYGPVQYIPLPLGDQPEAKLSLPLVDKFAAIRIHGELAVSFAPRKLTPTAALAWTD